MSSARRIVVAVNPVAGGRRQRGLGDHLVSQLVALGYECVVLQESDYGSLDARVRAEARDTDTLVVVGGDGMVNLGLNAVIGAQTSLAVLPAGTGNDFARGLGYSVDDSEACIQACIRAISREPVSLDVGHVRGGGVDRYFGGALSCGFDALVNERANRMRFPRGASRYTWAIFFELLGLRAREYQLTVDGKPRTERAVLISIANNSFLGGGMMVAPEASMQDGQLDVFLVKPVTRFRLIRLLPTVFSGKHVVEPEVEIVRAKQVSIGSRGIVVYADGERFGALPVTVDVREKAVRVHLPD